MACIRITFPKAGYETSTWVPDEEWYPLSIQQRGALIYRFIKNHHAKALNDSKHMTIPKNTPNYRWSEI